MMQHGRRSGRGSNGGGDPNGAFTHFNRRSNRAAIIRGGIAGGAKPTPDTMMALAENQAIGRGAARLRRQGRSLTRLKKLAMSTAN